MVITERKKFRLRCEDRQRCEDAMDEIAILTVEEMSGILKVSEKTCYRLIKDGKIRAIRVRGAIRISLNEVARYIKTQEESDGR